MATAIVIKRSDFKSKALTAALHNLGKLPTALGSVGKALRTQIRTNLNGRLLQRRSGTLHGSWDWRIEAKNAGWNVIVGSDVAYARIQDLGGWTGKGHKTHIKPTYYVRKSFEERKDQIERILRNYIKRIFY